MLQAIKKGLYRPVDVIGFCWSGRGLCQDGQDGPYAVAGTGVVSLTKLSFAFSVLAASISVNLGVTHSNFSC
jgi:hypothetical protein